MNNLSTIYDQPVGNEYTNEYKLLRKKERNMHMLKKQEIYTHMLKKHFTFSKLTSLTRIFF